VELLVAPDLSIRNNYQNTAIISDNPAFDMITALLLHERYTKAMSPMATFVDVVLYESLFRHRTRWAYPGRDALAAQSLF